jgi:hypothetical protein
MKSTSITSEVKRMTEKLHFIKIEAKGFQDICDRLAELEQENEFLDKQNKALKLRCGNTALKTRNSATKSKT